VVHDPDGVVVGRPDPQVARTHLGLGHSATIPAEAPWGKKTWPAKAPDPGFLPHERSFETSARHNLSTSDISLGADRDLGIPQALMSQR